MRFETYQVSGGDYHSINNYFTTSPESPDGSKVLYTRFFALPTRGPAGAPNLEKAQLWICDRDGGNHRPLSEVHEAQGHTGMTTVWLDDDTVAYHAAEQEMTYIVSLSSGESQAFASQRISHYSPITDKLLFCCQGSERFPVKGAYSVDREGHVELLARVEQIEAFCPLGAQGQNPYSPDTWRITHPYWSPDGTTISFLTRIRAGECYIHLMDPDGGNLRPWSRTTPRPMHYFWWDADSIYGHDHADGGDRFARRYDMHGNRIETVSGKGCHGTVSPDRQWIVTEDWYRTDPTHLYLYRRGETTPTEVLAVQKAHWRHSDMHPAFSFDGKRVYYNYHVAGDNKARLYCCDLSSIMS